MADQKISDMTAASSVVDADVVPIVQSGANKKSAFSVIKTYIQTAFNALYVPLTRTLTINGTAHDLSADRSWTTPTAFTDLTDTPNNYTGEANKHVKVRADETGLTFITADVFTAGNLTAAGTDGIAVTGGTNAVSGSGTSIAQHVADSTHNGYLSSADWSTFNSAAGGGAPNSAHYLTSQAEAGLTSEVNLGALSTGLLKGTVSGSVSTISSITDNSANWDTAFSQTRQWDGGATGLVAATGRASLALVIGTNVQAWDADLDTWATKTAPSGAVVGTTDTQTLTNKRGTPRITSIASNATPTINTDNCDCVTITALAVAITSMTTNLSGTPNNFDKLIIRFKDDGTGRAITWGASYASSQATLPTTTVAGKVTTVGLLWDSVKTKWVCLATDQEP